MIQYSSLNDAWGNSNKEIYKKNDNKVTSQSTPILQNEPTDISCNLTQTNIVLNTEKLTNSCKDDHVNINHINSCKQCQDKLKQVFWNNNIPNNNIPNNYSPNNNIPNNYIPNNYSPNNTSPNNNIPNNYIQINRNILKIIFILLIFIIFVLFISICKSIGKGEKTIPNANNKYYNDLYFDSYLRQMLYNRNL